MAEDKSSFVLYSDLIHTVSKLSDEQAGKLFKTILSYVNDENPVPDDVIVDLVFEPIKQKLKRDLKKWEGTRESRSETGRLGGIKSGEARRRKAEQNEANEANGSTSKQNEANEAVSVSVSVNVTDNVNDTVMKKGIVAIALPKSLTERETDFMNECTPFVSEFSKETVRAFFDYWSEKNKSGKKMKWEMQQTFEISKRLATWRSREKPIQHFTEKQNDRFSHNMAAVEKAIREIRQLDENEATRTN